MGRRKSGSLRGLIRMMVFSLGLSLVGSWGLLLPRLELEVVRSTLDQWRIEPFHLDLACLSLTFLGLFMAVYYRLRLGPRLKRMDYLGEERW